MVPQTNLEDYARRARRRLTIAAVVGAVCFAAGIGLVAALAPDESGEANPDDGAPEATGAQTPAVAGTPRAVEKPRAQTTPDAAPVPETSADAGRGEDTLAAPAEKPAVVEETGGAAADDKPENDKAEPTAAVPAEPKPEGDARWWLAVKGKRCKVVYGAHERLLVREGTLRRDETTTYGPFTDNDVVARVRRENATEVTVHHLGIHPRNGRPSLAHVTVHTGKLGDVEGILPLQIGGDQILLQPVSGGAK